MNIFFREMKANRKALIIWCICMFLLVVSGMGKYTAYSAGGSSNEVFSKLPYSMRALLGMGNLDVTQMAGFFAMLFLYIELAAAIHAALLGSGIIAKEERDKTTEFLIVKPVSRSTIITAKFAAAFLNIVILNVVTLIASLIMVSAYNKGKDISTEITLFLVSMFLVQLIFLTLGTALAAAIRRAKASGSLATGILLAAFIVSKITDLNEHAQALNVLSPFKYFDYTRLVEGNGLNILIVVLSLVLSGILVAATYVFYRKRDLSI